MMRSNATCWCAGLMLWVASGVALRAQEEAAGRSTPAVLVVVGAPGEEEFGGVFAESGNGFEEVAKRAGARVHRVGGAGESSGSDRERLKELIASEVQREDQAPLWIVFFGHGTFDGKRALFNLEGEDVSAADLDGWLKDCKRPVAIVQCASASGAFLPKLSRSGRVVVTATRSGNEQNYARFGSYFAKAISDPASDLDKDEQVSLLEAALAASHQVAAFYKEAGRLATEHALIDDTGDGLGTPADAEWFRGVHAVKKARDGAATDGVMANQWVLVPSAEERKLDPEVRRRRDEIERELARLRDAKSALAGKEYQGRLEALMLDLAMLLHPEHPVSKRKVFEPDENGMVFLMAKDGEVSGGGLKLEPGPEFGAVAPWSAAGGSVKWNLRVARPGTFEVRARVAASKAGAGIGFEVVAAGHELEGVTEDSGGDTEYRDLAVGQVEFGGIGVYEVTVRCARPVEGGSMRLGGVALAPANSATR